MHKKYLKKAHSFLFKNKPVFVLYLFFFASATISGFLIETEYDTYGLVTVLSIIISILFLKYALLLPKLIYENNYKITSKQLGSLVKDQNWRTFKAYLIVIPYGIIIGLYQFLISSLLGTPPFGASFGQQHLNDDFGFYPREVLDMVVLVFVTAPIYIFPIAYFVRNFSLWQSFKHSLQFTIEHRNFVFPSVAIYSIYYVLAYLFINPANYYALPLRLIIETYLSLLIIIAIYFYYMEHAPKLKSRE